MLILKQEQSNITGEKLMAEKKQVRKRKSIDDEITQLKQLLKGKEEEKRVKEKEELNAVILKSGQVCVKLDLAKYLSELNKDEIAQLVKPKAQILKALKGFIVKEPVVKETPVKIVEEAEAIAS